MRLKRLELAGFKSFAKKTVFLFESPITAIVGPNGSGKSNVAEAFRWVLGEQSMKSLRGKRGEDLIWNGSERESRSARAAATVVFDNTDRRLKLDFEEVAVSREVHRDGENTYRLNGSLVRLRDVLELLADISLGPSGHHIVSQGDADRILSASPEERKLLIEDALGLKIYQWKLLESRKKLAKTEENERQVEALRREIGPHLKFLRRQVEKLVKADEYRRELKRLYQDYLPREAAYLKRQAEELAAAETAPLRELELLTGQLAEREKLLKKGDNFSRRQLDTLSRREGELASLRERKDQLTRDLGRLEGMIEAQSPAGRETAEAAVPVKVVKNLVGELKAVIIEGEAATEPGRWRRTLLAVKHRLEQFLQQDLAVYRPSATLSKLLAEREEMVRAISRHDELLTAAEAQLAELKQVFTAEREEAFAAERDLFALRHRQTELNLELANLKTEREKWQLQNTALEQELSEGSVLVDQEIKALAKLSAALGEDRVGQLRRRREIERLKIKLEDLGGENNEVLKEYEQMNAREEYLAKELADLAASAAGLKKIMAELEAELENNFQKGLAKINTEFTRYFALMFGGGEARLRLNWPDKRHRPVGSGYAVKVAAAEELFSPPEAEEESKPGIDIQVNLPRKKIKGLQMLSGGERALTSIALLFAMAAVNPPPFLILDETDAALDEANSKKYGDMIEALAKSSQLILITHNRETMSRAGILYGVTMGGDGVSRLLSVRFDEAQGYAK